MKKHLLAMSLVASFLFAKAQTFTDDFESYDNGDMLAATSPDWSTWTSANGGADDVAVVNTNAHSGSNSIYFASTAAAGGPSDIVKPFPGELLVGQFNLEMWLYINSTGTGAYFNLQEDAAIGTTWASDVYFLDGGIAQFTSGGTLLLAASYPEDIWFKLRMENNLSTNTWEIFIDDVSQGSYANGSTQIASIDIYPVLNNQFYIDDFSYEFTDYEVPGLNGAVVQINNFGGLATQQITPEVVVRNLGSTTINSFTVTLDYNGNTLTESVSAVNIASLAFYTVDFSSQFTLAAGANDAVATISAINGGSGDDTAEDDVKTLTVDPIVPAAGKKVVAEEATGTWCPWCVRGTVFMNTLHERYGNLYVGIAVHNADPMVFGPYDAGVGALITGYPSGFVDRGDTYDPSQFEIPFLERIQTAPAALITNGATWDASTRVLAVSATTTFQENVSGNWKIALVLTEDDVTGSGSQWGQNNAYAGGGNGDMGGFEDLPNPVPAAQMEYDHVARIISPSFAGLPNAYSGMMNSGNSSTHNFTFTLPAGWDENNIHIVAMVIAPDGTIDNASFTTMSEAVDNGFVAGTAVVGVSTLAAPDENIAIYPVPAHDQCFLNIDLKQATEFIVEIFSADGRMIASKDYGTLSGAMRLPIQIAEWNTGIYKVKIVAGETMYVKTIVKE